MTGVVSAATPEAAAAGAEILKRGGNAVDAAVATSLVLCVTEPAGSGIAGQTVLLVHAPGEEPLVVDGASFAPRAVPADVSPGAIFGHRATTVPTTLRALETAWRKLGSGAVGWPELCEPAIAAAREGFPLGRFRWRALVRYARALRRNRAARELVLGPDGEVPETGRILRFPALAETLERIAREGARDFYEGEIARRIIDDMQERSGWLTASDLAQCPESPIRPALLGSFRGRSVATLPPPASGWVVLLALNILECADAEKISTSVEERILWLVDALSLAHRERLDRPVPDVLNYARHVAARTDKNLARSLVDTLGAMREMRGETTHFSVADGDGRVVACTQSLNNYFGAKVAHPELGFFYNDYLREYAVSGAPASYPLKGGMPPYSSMSATTVSRDGRPVLALGSPAHDRIISAVVQVLWRVVECGQTLAEAVAAPRIHVSKDGYVLFENRHEVEPAALLRVEGRGFSCFEPVSSMHEDGRDPFFGGVHAVAVENDAWVGAADPRRDGAVVYPDD